MVSHADHPIDCMFCHSENVFTRVNEEGKVHVWCRTCGCRFWNN